MNLIEAYKDRLAVSEAVYKKAHLNEGMSEQKKLATAVCLNNISKFINEAFANSVGTQRSDLGNYKKFTLNLTTVALPNLIAFDLVIVQPMTAMTGSVAYVQYVAGSNKGATKQGDVFNDPFRLGKVDPAYTSQVVAETVKVTSNVAHINWTPVVPAETEVKVGGTAKTVITEGTPAAGQVLVEADGKLTFFANEVADNTDVAVKYVYDNVVIPQNDLPILNARIENIPLLAKARRIAIYYSQIANYQAKTDYGFDLGDQLAEKAVGQLNYEIDTEIVDLLAANAAQDGDLVWSKTLPVGVSKAEHYEGFSEIIEIGKQKIYDRTKRFAPTYIVIASNVLPVLTFMKGFQAAPANNINGPYFAGSLNGLKVFVSPSVEAGTFFLGVNGSDLMSSAAVYAPYMPIIPTQLLGYSDGAMSQGFSTMYDLKLLNKDLLVAGRVTA